MKSIYFLGGIVCLILGSLIVIRQVKLFIKGQQDKLGFGVQLLGGGIMAIILGIGMIIQNI